MLVVEDEIRDSEATTGGIWSRDASELGRETDFADIPGTREGSGWCSKGMRGSAVGGYAPSNGAVSLNEQVAVRPTAREVEPDLPDRGLNPRADLEQLQSNRGGFRSLQGGSSQPLAKQMHQVIGQGMQLKTEGVGSIPMTAEPIGMEIGLPLVNTVFRFASTVVGPEQILGSSFSVGHDASDVEALAADFHFDQDPTLVGPSPSSIPKAGDDPYGFARSFKPFLSSSHEGIGMAPKHRVVGDSDEILDVLLFQEVQQLGRGKAGIGSKADRSPGKGASKTGKDSLEFGKKTFEIGSRAGT